VAAVTAVVAAMAAADIAKPVARIRGGCHNGNRLFLLGAAFGRLHLRGLT
jgi:hypothetical protein